MSAAHNDSPVTGIYAQLGALNPSWRVDVGAPSGPGWITGADLTCAASGPFHDLLVRIGDRARTTDKRTIAASFAVRYGWASAMAIAPFLEHDCVPDISLGNVSFKFRESTFFEKTAIHEPRGVMVAGDGCAAHPSMATVATPDALLRTLRTALVAQAAPVVDALFDWSGFSPKGSWGMLTSSWAAHFTSLGGDRQDQRTIAPIITRFFAGDDVVTEMQPRLHPVEWMGVTHLYQRRASCCRWYLLPQGELCASCPLVSQEERVARNLAWMKTQLERPAGASSGGHT